MKTKIIEFINRPVIRMIAQEVLVGIISYGITSVALYAISYGAGMIKSHFINPETESHEEELVC